VRRLLTVSAVAAILFVAFALARTIFAPAMAAQMGMSPSSTQSSMTGATPSSRAAANGTATSKSASSSPNEPLVVAVGITARALTIHPSARREQVYYTDSYSPNRVLALQPGDSGAYSFSAVAGTGATGSLGDGGAANSAQFNLELDSLFERSGIAIAADGTMFIADTLNATIRSIAGPESSEPGVIRSVAGRWAPSQNVALVEPMGIALDRVGNLYIADHGANAIVELHADTGLLEKLVEVESPASIAVAADGSKILVASPGKGAVISIETATRAIQQIIRWPHGTSEALAFARANGHSFVSVNPAGVAVDSGGNLFVADAGGNQILRFSAPSSVKASAKTIFAEDLHGPGDMAFDEKGNLYVSDQVENQILEFVGAGTSQPSVTLSPTSFAFGDQPTGSSTTAQSFTLTNNSGSALTGVAITFVGGNPADFVNSSTNCLASLANATSCTINVAFAPMAEGARSSTLTVNSSFMTAPTAALSGTGDTYTLALAPGQLDTVTVIAGQTATWMMQATNDATFTGTVTFVCPTQLPTLTFCSFTPASVNFTTPNQTIPFTASIMTTSRTPGKNPAAVLPSIGRPVGTRGGPGGPLRFPAIAMGFSMSTTFAMIFLLALAVSLCVWKNRRTGDRAGWTMPALQRRWVSVAALLVAIAAIAFVGGCHHHNTVATGTPPGTANLILQGTAQGATRPIGITLVVK